MRPNQFRDWNAARQFILAGNAIITLRSLATGTRFTFRIQRTAPERPWFVSLLRGAENLSDYSFLGTIFLGHSSAPLTYRHGSRSRISVDAPSARAFRWFWEQSRDHQRLPTTLEVWHEGRCGRCGRALTVPESLARGLGPECAGSVGGALHPQLPLGRPHHGDHAHGN